MEPVSKPRATRDRVRWTREGTHGRRSTLAISAPVVVRLSGFRDRRRLPDRRGDAERVPRVSMTLSGSHSVRWITHGRETRWSEKPKTLHLFPADGDRHMFITDAPPGFRQAAVFIPASHLADMAASEWVSPPSGLRRAVWDEDRVMGICVAALGSLTRQDEARLDSHNDEIARRLVLRLCELHGTGRPDWHDDASVFDRRRIGTLVAFIDEHLRVGPSVYRKQFSRTNGSSGGPVGRCTS